MAAHMGPKKMRKDTGSTWNQEHGQLCDCRNQIERSRRRLGVFTDRHLSSLESQATSFTDPSNVPGTYPSKAGAERLQSKLEGAGATVDLR